MPTQLDEGTATLVIDTPNTFYASTANKHFAGWIDFDEMIGGDITLLEVQTKVLTGDGFKTFYKQTFSGIDGGLDAPVFLLPYVPGTYGYKIILTQTAGTGRDYKWQVNEP